jgi:hypothetical protein
MIFTMGRTALYRDPIPFRPERAEVQLEGAAVTLRMADGRSRRHVLDGVTATITDGFVAARIDDRGERRFVRMLVLERGGDKNAVITPPDQGAVAPNVVRLPQAPADASIVDARAWESLADWVVGGGRLASWSIADLASLATISTPQFAVVIGEVAAERALEQVWASGGPLRGGASDFDTVLQPLADAARQSSRASEALVSALSHAAGASRRRRLA